MKVIIKEGGESETIEVGRIERGTFRTTETHSTKVTHEEGEDYTVLRGLQPGDSELLRGHDFVWLSGSMADPRSTGPADFPLVYIPDGHGIEIETFNTDTN